jgi:hypothetical protein
MSVEVHEVLLPSALRTQHGYVNFGTSSAKVIGLRQSAVRGQELRLGPKCVDEFLIPFRITFLSFEVRCSREPRAPHLPTAVKSNRWRDSHCFHVRLDPTAHPASCVMGTGLLCPGVKRPGRGVEHLPSTNAEVKERVELYIYFLFRPSWPVTEWTVPDLNMFINCALNGYFKSPNKTEMQNVLSRTVHHRHVWIGVAIFIRVT